MIGSPSNLELLLHCYYSAEPHPRHDAPAIQEGLRFLMNEGMVRSTTTAKVYQATPRAEAFINHLMEVPFPVQVWTMPT